MTAKSKVGAYAVAPGMAAKRRSKGDGAPSRLSPTWALNIFEIGKADFDWRLGRILRGPLHGHLRMTVNNKFGWYYRLRRACAAATSRLFRTEASFVLSDLAGALRRRFI